jgi:hydroxyacylglutathione hydrolase
MPVDHTKLPETIDTAELQSLLDEGVGVQVIDVRLPFDYFGGRVPGSLNVPALSITGRLGPIPADRPLVMVCDDGVKSAEAAAAARGAGFTNVTVLAGGYDAWLDADMPTETISEGIAPPHQAAKTKSEA